MKIPPGSLNYNVTMSLVTSFILRCGGMWALFISMCRAQPGRGHSRQAGARTQQAGRGEDTADRPADDLAGPDPACPL